VHAATAAAVTAHATRIAKELVDEVMNEMLAGVLAVSCVRTVVVKLALFSDMTTTGMQHAASASITSVSTSGSR